MGRFLLPILVLIFVVLAVGTFIYRGQVTENNNLSSGPTAKIDVPMRERILPPAKDPLPGSIVNALGMEFVPFQLESRSANSQTYISRFEVTQQQLARILDRSDRELAYSSRFSGNGERKEEVALLNPYELAADDVSFDQAQEFCLQLSELPIELDARREYRLPSETEWESASQPKRSQLAEWTDSKSLDQIGWFKTNSGSRPHYVGETKADANGLNDILGNVSEWCVANGSESGKITGIARGGSYLDAREGVIEGMRQSNREGAGIRVVLEVYPPSHFVPQPDQIIGMIDDIFPLLASVDAHTGGVTAMAITTDGRLLISGGFNGKICIWNIAQQKQTQTFEAHEGEIKSVDVNEVGEIVTIGADGFVRDWNLAGPKMIREARASEEPPDESIVVEGEETDRHGIAWNSEFITSEFEWLEDTQQRSYSALKVAMNRTRRKLEFWQDGKNTFSIELPEVAEVLRYAKKLKIFITGCRDGSIKFWKYRDDPDAFTQLPPISNLAVSGDGKFAATLDEEQWLTVFDLRTGEEILDDYPSICIEENLYDRERFLCFSKDGMRLATILGRQLSIWDLTAGEELTGQTLPFNPHQLHLDPQDNHLVVVGQNVSTWQFTRFDMDALKVVEHKRLPGDFNSLYHRIGNKFLRHIEVDARNETWDFSANETTPLNGFGDFLINVKYTASGSRALLDSYALDTPIVYDFEMNRIVFQDRRAKERISFSSDGRYLVSKNVGGPIRVWDIDGNREIATLWNRGIPIDFLELTSDNRIVTSDMRGNVLVHDLPIELK